jgi:hypothetical protein
VNEGMDKTLIETDRDSFRPGNGRLDDVRYKYGNDLPYQIWSFQGNSWVWHYRGENEDEVRHEFRGFQNPNLTYSYGLINARTRLWIVAPKER